MVKYSNGLIVFTWRQRFASPKMVIAVRQAQRRGLLGSVATVLHEG
jgi:hypothetical protein